MNYKTKMEKEFEFYELYREKIDSHDFFMDFDRYGQLKFISSSSLHNTIIKLENLWGKEQIKINNLLVEYHGLLSNIKQASKGTFKPGVI